MSTDTRPPLDVTIHGLCSGYTVEISLSLPIDKIAEACQRLQAAGITPAPAQPSGAAPSAPAGPRKARRPHEAPFYNDAGDPCCPYHPDRPLDDSQFGGVYCKAKGGPHPNDRGYCSYAWKGDL